MAPQQTFYGSVPMETQKEERPSRFLRRALVTTGVVVLVSLAVFAASSSLQSTASVTDATKMAKARSKNKGDNLEMWKPDCKCRYGTCPKAAKGKKTYCGVTNAACMGADYGPAIDAAGKSIRYNKAIDCTKEGPTKKDADAPCRAVCDVVVGRNQCDSFPCMNGGWCKDGYQGYTCFCKAGWMGNTCSENINECDATGKKAVCDKNAICTDNDGGYTCKCGDGWTGKGYAAPANVPVPSWMEKVYEASKSKPEFIYGCTDINDCGIPQKRCKNGGKCQNQEGVKDGWSCDCRKGVRTKVSLFVTGADCSVDFNECSGGKRNDCDVNAQCVNEKGGNGDGFNCVCNKNWKSTDPAGQDHHGRNNRIHVTGTAVGAKKDYQAGCYDIDDCASKPCKNGGTCEPGLPGCQDANGAEVPCFTCKCAVGWSGDLCERDEDECDDSMSGKKKTKFALCREKDSTTCINTAGSYGCRCNLGWTGDPISVKGCVDANDCEFSPCSHGGTCLDCGTLCFSCDCVVGWRGTTCGTDWNECLMGIHRCDDSATCVNTPGSYTCKCDPGYTGNGVGSAYLEAITYTVGGVKKTKHVQHGCKDINDCDPKEYDGTGKIPGWQASWNQGPCKYGTCEDVGAGAYSCTCWDGWTDSNCDTNINECDSMTGSSECSQFATCLDLPGKGNPAPKKVVAAGASCADAKSPFNTNAKCTATKVRGNMTPKAKCASTDPTKCTKEECCELPSSCSAGPFKSNKLCRNAGMGKAKRGAKCLDTDPKKCTKEECCEVAALYTCTCNQGFAGDGFHCFDKEDCTPKACNNHGFCSDLGVDQFQCSCDKGYEDSDCSKNTNECTDYTHECGRDALCVDTPGSYICKCPKGFVGYPNQVFGKGIPCEDKNDCKGNGGKGPCRNAKSCRDDGVDLYVCDCNTGWTDYDCDFDVNECLGDHDCWQGTPTTGPYTQSQEEHHIKNGVVATFGAAKCINTPGGYKCQCPKGMIGKGRKGGPAVETVSGKFGTYKAYLAQKGVQCACGPAQDKETQCRKAKTAKECRAKKGKWVGETGDKNIQMLPMGCVDYDDCRTIGDDGLWHTNDKNEGEIPGKCSTAEVPRGTCKDTGAFSYTCDCKKGWGCGSPMCDKDCDECTEKTHDCSEHATCKNRLAAIDPKGKVREGYSCTCNHPISFREGNNHPGYYGAADGKNCMPCTVCPKGFRALGICKTTDRTCKDINECENEEWVMEDGKTKQSVHPCDKKAKCNNTPGSFTCECNDGYFALAQTAWRPNLANKNSRGCKICTVCREGFHVHTPCTRQTDTVCKRDVPAYVPAIRKGKPFDSNTAAGTVIIKTEADENLQCLTIRPGSWYPSRVDYGGVGQCGAPSKAEWAKLKPRVVWSFTGLGDNTKEDELSGLSNLYLIRYQGKRGKCLFFGDDGAALYPSLQHCKDTYKTSKCPWDDPQKEFCGFPGGRRRLLKNKQAVWKVTTLKLSEDKFILQSAARKKADMSGKAIFECLVFEKQGTETNPTRYNWGNGNRMCGVGNWGDNTLALALMNNKQAVFILESYTGFEHSNYQFLKHREWHMRRRTKVAAEAAAKK